MEEEVSVMQDRRRRSAVCCGGGAKVRAPVFLFAATRVGRSGEEGIMGDGGQMERGYSRRESVGVTAEEGRSRLPSHETPCVN